MDPNEVGGRSGTEVGRVSAQQSPGVPRRSRNPKGLGDHGFPKQSRDFGGGRVSILRRGERNVQGMEG